MSCIEGKWGGKDIHCSAQNAALFVDLSWIIFSLDEWLGGRERRWIIYLCFWLLNLNLIVFKLKKM